MDLESIQALAASIEWGAQAQSAYATLKNTLKRYPFVSTSEHGPLRDSFRAWQPDMRKLSAEIAPLFEDVGTAQKLRLALMCKALCDRQAAVTENQYGVLWQVLIAWPFRGDAIASAIAAESINHWGKDERGIRYSRSSRGIFLRGLCAILLVREIHVPPLTSVFDLD